MNHVAKIHMLRRHCRLAYIVGRSVQRITGMFLNDRKSRKLGWMVNRMLTTLATAPYILLARSFFVILGCFAVLWGIIELPAFWRDASIKRIATRIIAGDPFKIETLTQQAPIIDGIRRSAYCRPAALQSAAIIELRMWEVSPSAKDRQHPDEQFKSLGNRGAAEPEPAAQLRVVQLLSGRERSVDDRAAQGRVRGVPQQVPIDCVPLSRNWHFRCQ